LSQALLATVKPSRAESRQHHTDNFGGLSIIVFHCLRLRDGECWLWSICHLVSVSRITVSCGQAAPSCLCLGSHMALN
ncbi:hypothetical protein N302_06377, partial [Corvus brachyrhynchos]